MFIRLFRRNSGNLRNYLLYALGEVVLIVIGILIVVEIDKWKQASADRKKEIDILKEIRDGFKRDIGDLTFNIWLHEGAITSAQIVLDHFERKAPYHDSLSHHFARSLAFSRLVVDEGPYEHLKSMGLKTVSDNDLRIRIEDMYDYEFESMKIFETNTFVNEWNTAEILQTRFDRTEIWRAVDDTDFHAGRMIPVNYTALRDDDIYKHLLRSLISKNEFYVNFFIRPNLERLRRLTEDLEVAIAALEE